MKPAMFLFILCIATTTADAAVALRSIRITHTGFDKDPSAEMCADFSLTRREVAAFFAKSVPITRYELHDNYDWGPCFVRGTAMVNSRPVTWEIRIGGTASYTSSDGTYYDVAGPLERYEQD